MLKHLYWFIYVTSLLFMLSGAFNYGISRFLCAIPFMVLSIWIAIVKFQNMRMRTVSIIFCFSAIIINITLEKNPLIFPILNGGTVTILRNGFLKSYIGGSGRFVTTNKETNRCNGCGEVTYHRLWKGEKYKITKVIIFPDFSSINIELQTSVGRFDIKDEKSKGVVFSHRPESPIFQHFGNLMYYPLLPIIIWGYLK